MNSRRQYLLYVSMLTIAVVAIATSSFAQTKDINVANTEQTWDGVQAGARAGTWLDQGALRARTLSTDKRKDLIVGAPGGAGIVGTVYVIYGGPVRTGAQNLASADAIIAGEAVGDLFGTSTAAGNILTTEGFNPVDLVVGAPGASGGRGAVYLFRGGFTTGARLDFSSAVFKIVGQPGDQLGSMLATADLNGDGHREIIIGAPGNSRVYVIQGSTSLSGVQDLSVTPAKMTISIPGIGNVLAAGDVTGDNVEDLLIGSPSTNQVIVFNGIAGAFPTQASAVLAGVNPGDQAGASIRLADMDGDGKKDILIGAPGGAGIGNAQPNSGEAYLFWGGAPLTSRSLAAADVTFYGRPGERLGAVIAAGDVNRDTPNDAIILAEAAASGNGILYLYYGRARTAFGSDLGNGQRLVDFNDPNQVSRRIGSDPTLGPIKAAQAFEVTGEGARDVVVGIPTINSNTGRVFFTLSPKMTISKSAIAASVAKGGSFSTTFVIDDPTSIPITFTIKSDSSWLTVSPTDGGVVQGSPATITVSANSAGLNPGTYTGNLSITSTSPDLTMTLPLVVTLSINQTLISIDGPVNGSTIAQPFNLGGWALDLGAASGTGIDAVHLWAVPLSGASAVFLGALSPTNARPDVAAAFGSQFNNSGYNLQVSGLTPGGYQFVAYAHNAATGNFDAWKVVTVTVKQSSAMNVDTPASGSTVGSSFLVAGWAIDAAAAAGTGVDAVHVWAIPTNGGNGVFLGAASYGDARSDVGGAYGSRFTNAGFHLNASGLAPGDYTLVVYAHSTVSNAFDQSRGFLIHCVGSARMSVDAPANNSTVSSGFALGGWAIDLASTSGTGVDAVQVWATPTNGGGAVFLGAANYGSTRNDVATAYGSSRFANSGFNMVTNALAPGTYIISVYAHSSVANAYNDIVNVTVTVR